MNAALETRDPHVIGPAEGDGYSLPAWIYHDPGFFELEKQKIFRTSWQLVCHRNDIPKRW